MILPLQTSGFSRFVHILFLNALPLLTELVKQLSYVDVEPITHNLHISGLVSQYAGVHVKGVKMLSIIDRLHYF